MYLFILSFSCPLLFLYLLPPVLSVSLAPCSSGSSYRLLFWFLIPPALLVRLVPCSSGFSCSLLCSSCPPLLWFLLGILFWLLVLPALLVHRFLAFTVFCPPAFIPSCLHLCLQATCFHLVFHSWSSLRSPLQPSVFPLFSSCAFRVLAFLNPFSVLASLYNIPVRYCSI